MNVCIVGGIFGRSEAYRERHRFAPEVVLAEGLRARGVAVETVSHASFRPLRGRWDLVHVHHLGEGAVRAASAGGTTPFVFTSHDGAILCSYERSLSRWGAFSYVVRRADALIALSEAEAAYLARNHALGERTVVVRNGIRADVFQLPPPRPPAAPRSLLYVGQLIPLKGVDVLLRALARLPGAERPRLRLVYQNAELEPELRGLTARLQLEPWVDFVGFVGPSALAGLYAESDALVLPSHAEALPSVVTEAMLSGLPVVASNVGGIPEQVGRSGALAPPGDVEALALALARLLPRLPLSQHERLGLRAQAMAHCSVPAMIDGHLEVYERLLRARRAARGRNMLDLVAHTAIELHSLTRGAREERVAA